MGEKNKSIQITYHETHLRQLLVNRSSTHKPHCMTTAKSNEVSYNKTFPFRHLISTCKLTFMIQPFKISIETIFCFTPFSLVWIYTNHTNHVQSFSEFLLDIASQCLSQRPGTTRQWMVTRSERVNYGIFKPSKNIIQGIITIPRWRFDWDRAFVVLLDSVQLV